MEETGKQTYWFDNGVRTYIHYDHGTQSAEVYSDALKGEKTRFPYDKLMDTLAGLKMLGIKTGRL